MKAIKKRISSDEMRPEYDLVGGVRGKYYKRYISGCNIVKLDSDVAKAFSNSESVNKSLRALLAIYKDNKIKA
jgi:hypothetical protein